MFKRTLTVAPTLCPFGVEANALRRKIPMAKKLVLIQVALIGLGTIAQAQQTEGERSEAALSEMFRVKTLCEDITERLKNTDVSDARAALEICQKLLPKLDDAYRTMMTYGDTSLRSETQRWYTTTRQTLLDNLVIAQRRLGTLALQSAPTPSPIAVATPPDSTSSIRSLADKRLVELEKEDALAFSELLISYLKQSYSKPTTIEQKWAIVKIISDEALRGQYKETALFVQIVRDQIYDKLGWSLDW
jgi:hypothetical protein